MNGPRYIETDAILHKFRERSFKIHQEKVDRIKNRSLVLRRENNKIRDIPESPKKELVKNNLNLDQNHKRNVIELSSNIPQQHTYDNSSSPLLKMQNHKDMLSQSNSKASAEYYSKNLMSNSSSKNRNASESSKNMHSYIQYMDDDYTLKLKNN